MRPKSSGAKASPGERTVAQEALFHTPPEAQRAR